MKNLNDLMQEDSNSKKEATNEQLNEIAILIDKLKHKKEKFKELEERLKVLKDEINQLSQIKIPDLFDTIGLSTLKMKTGESVEVNRSYAATITKANQDQCFSWLIDNGHGGIIKREVVISLQKGDNETFKELEGYLKDRGHTYSPKETVHYQTLKAFVKEQMEKGSDIPQDKFKIFPLRETKLK